MSCGILKYPFLLNFLQEYVYSVNYSFFNCLEGFSNEITSTWRFSFWNVFDYKFNLFNSYKDIHVAYLILGALFFLKN